MMMRMMGVVVSEKGKTKKRKALKETPKSPEQKQRSQQEASRFKAPFFIIISISIPYL